jgi:hypothetical protein
VNYGSSITFTVAANANYHTTDVRVDGVSKGVLSTYTFTTVVANHTITSAYAINTYIITPTAGANGTITPGSPQTVTYGSSITFTITPAGGYAIADVRVDGVSQGAVATYTFSGIAANHTITASFALNPVYTLTVSLLGNGSGVVTSLPLGIDCGITCTTTFSAGTVVTLTETPALASAFTGWGGACSGTGSCVVTMNTAQSVSATFTTYQAYLPNALR